MAHAFSVLCVAVIGKTNNPLFVKNFSSTYTDLKCHYIAHTAIDLVEERIGSTKHTDQYLGLLYTMEDLAVFGYITNTRVKFIIVTNVVDVAIKDQDIKNLFRKIHNAYVILVSNPFYDPDSKRPIASTNFEKAISSL
ncbi:trafficking protein particle complex 2 [Fimicolochytrium jonesii]|uniref:trafficking protein particle complex 2 n=1 Tax=Fimicolochytrium jonesii TaxID=1396493 RepID=UPI0022FE2CE3|nr:trafficking protein particle complex 2 [Fimicolochytrium jonesii]KAI8818551.1 trafficking protein particle complex 2 [Fimicolochytrium jonesii]